MSDKKISELPPVSTLSLDDLLAVVNEGETRHIRLRQLIQELQLDIPQPRIKIRKDVDGQYFGHDQVFAFWEGSDNRFLKFNPEFWLYRYKKAELKSFVNKESGKRERVWRKKRFVHPSHNHGAKYFREEDGKTRGTSRFDGEQMIQFKGEKKRIPSRNTEWAVGTNPLNETHLDLAPWTYYRTAKMDPFLGLNPQADFPMDDQPTPRGTGSSKSRFVVFKVRIAIDNPDPSSDEPKLFGPFSETFILYPHKRDRMYRSLKYYLGAEAAPQLRKA